MWKFIQDIKMIFLFNIQVFFHWDGDHVYL